jgi:alpha-beta hydrolase superfamily lysophospholipase
VRSADYLINYEITCSGTGPTLLLVAGLGEQIGTVEFPEEQCQHFAAQGYQVIRMDNRGMGLSRPISGTDEGSSALPGPNDRLLTCCHDPSERPSTTS